MDHISTQHLEELRRAKHLLEKPSLASKMTDKLGSPIEKGIRLLPENWSTMVREAVQNSLHKALELSAKSLGTGTAAPARERFHKVAVITVGATGGAFGLAGLAVELPVSTTLILRSIADIARSEGEDIDSVEARLACLEVFALGGRSPSDDAAETGYFAVRSALAKSVSDAARYIAQRGFVEEGAPALIRFVSAVASRFGVVVSEKVAAMAIPAIGAAGGAIINAIFINHFQDVARGHFMVRRLERLYPRELIEREYQKAQL